MGFSYYSMSSIQHYQYINKCLVYPFFVDMMMINPPSIPVYAQEKLQHTGTAAEAIQQLVYQRFDLAEVFVLGQPVLIFACSIYDEDLAIDILQKGILVQCVSYDLLLFYAILLHL